MNDSQTYDFCGWATRFNVGCSDGRTIMPGAFAHSDGAVVPLIWNHQHDGAENVVGKAILEARDEGMYAYGFFNGTENGQIAKELVQHGDIDSLSIFANHLKESNGCVMHGEIKELSLVLAGANIEAKIEDVICHDDDGLASAIIYSGVTGFEYLEHSDLDEEYYEDEDYEYYEYGDEDLEDEDYEEEFDDDFDTEIEEEVDEDFGDDYDDIEEYDDYGEDELEHSDTATNSKSMAAIFDTLTDEQKLAVYMMIDAAANNEGDDTMKHNAFESYGSTPAIDLKAFEKDVINDIKRFGSVKESYLQHSADLIDEYNDTLAEMEEGGYLAHATDITDENFDEFFDAALTGTNGAFGPAFKSAMAASPYLRDEYDPMAIGFRQGSQNMLLPNAHELNATPKFISRNMEWVAKVLNGVRTMPFSRIKCTFADITEDEARAHGYMKGKYKKNEIFSLLKRTTQPCTIYKKKAMDRDDWIDVTDFDMIAWIKSEMTIMINEEKARAILIGDGRVWGTDEDAIDPSCIRPIVNDEDLFVLRWGVQEASGKFDAKEFINTCIRSRKNYKGAGRPTLFTTEDVLTEMLLLEDTIGHKLYKTEEEIKTAIRVSEIVTVPVLEGFVDKDGNETSGTGRTVYGIIVNLSDYAVGTDVRGKRAMFDDFDIDYNKMKYLIEERFSGSLITPFSAIVIRKAKNAGEAGSQEVALNNWQTGDGSTTTYGETESSSKQYNKGASAQYKDNSDRIK